MNLGLLAVCCETVPAVASAQTRTSACSDSTTYFEFQVAKPAAWISDSAQSVHPTAANRLPADGNLIQFVVDTAGNPVTRTLRVLKLSDSSVVNEARRSLANWRFEPAQLNGCAVRQLVQTPVGR
jgi:outer membrane biosynthesis protein TonB